MADIVVLGKLAQVIVPAVRKFAQQNWALFLEAERRNVHNALTGLEAHIEHEQSKLAEKERELGAVLRVCCGARDGELDCSGLLGTYDHLHGVSSDEAVEF